MHIHGNQMNFNSISPYSAAEKAGAAQKAADVRKKLAKGAAAIEGASTPEEAFMIGQWTNSAQIQVQNQDEYHTAASGKDSDFA